VIVNIRIWRDFLISRDSEFEIIKGSNIQVDLNYRLHRPIKEVKAKVKIKLKTWIR